MGDNWYYQAGDRVEGPLTLAQLRGMAAEGKLRPGDKVCGEDGVWRDMSEVAGGTAGTFAGAGIAGTATVPHAAPSLSYPAPGMHNPQVPDYGVALIKSTGLWVRIVAILFTIGLFFMLMASVGMLVAAALARPREVAPFIALGIMYFLMVCIYVAPLVFLYKYSGRAKAFARLRDEQNLVGALAAQKSFWKYVAILMLVILGLYVIMIPLVVGARFLVR
jgi:hypothetical protein